LIFKDVDQGYDCGVARDAGTYRTVGVSFELGGLIDGSGVSTRAALLDSILHFFGIFQVPVYEENAQKDIKNISFAISPNPFKGKTIIRYMIQDTRYRKNINLRIYDASGRMVRDFSRLTVNSERSMIVWDGTDDAGGRLPSGVYFVKLEGDEFRKTEKMILLR
jgi:hypothetical protein